MATIQHPADTLIERLSTKDQRFAPLREQARQALRERGFPTTREERWRFTNIAPLLETDYEPAPHAVPAEAPLPEWAQALDPVVVTISNNDLLIDDGVHAAVPEGAFVGNVEDADAAGVDLSRFGTLANHFDDNRFAALATAAFDDALVVYLPAGKTLSKPLLVQEHVVAEGDVATTPRILVIAEAQARLDLLQVQSGDGEGRSLNLPIVETWVGAGAQVQHVTVNTRARPAATLGVVAAEIHGREGAYHWHSVALGSGFDRTDANAYIRAEQAHATLNGVYLAGEQLNTPRRTAPAMSFSKACCTARHARCSTAASMLPATLKRPIRSSPIRCCCCPTMRYRTPTPSWKSMPMMCAAHTEPRPGNSMTWRCSTC